MKSPTHIIPSFVLSAIAVSLAAAISAFAEPQSAVTMRGGTLGAGFEYVRNIAPTWNVRLGANYFQYNKSSTYSQVKYDGTLDLASGAVLFDWYPWKRGARLSMGGILNGNTVKLSGLPQDGSYTINGHDYTVAEVGTLSGKANFRATAPYLGIGFGNPLVASHRLSLTLDLGAMYEGKPKVSYAATGTAAGSASLAGDLNAERAKLYRSIKNYFDFYPVISLGLSYKF